MWRDYPSLVSTGIPISVVRAKQFAITKWRTSREGPTARHQRRANGLPARAVRLKDGRTPALPGQTTQMHP